MKDTVHPIIEETTSALNIPTLSSDAISFERGAPPISFANKDAGIIDGSTCKTSRTKSKTGERESAISGEMIIIPIIERDMFPRSINPFSNSFESPSLLPMILSNAPIIENTSIITETKFIPHLKALQRKIRCL